MNWIIYRWTNISLLKLGCSHALLVSNIASATQRGQQRKSTFYRTTTANIPQIRHWIICGRSCSSGIQIGVCKILCNFILHKLVVRFSSQSLSSSLRCSCIDHAGSSRTKSGGTKTANQVCSAPCANTSLQAFAQVSSCKSSPATKQHASSCRINCTLG